MTEFSDSPTPSQVGKLIGALAAATVALVSTLACRSLRAPGPEAEARELVERLDRVVETAGAARAQALLGLEEAACTQDETCEFRRVCLRAYRSHDTSTKELSEVRQRLTGTPATDPLPADTAERLSQAEAALEDAVRAAERCLGERLALVRRYDLR